MEEVGASKGGRGGVGACSFVIVTFLPEARSSEKRKFSRQRRRLNEASVQNNFFREKPNSGL